MPKVHPCSIFLFSDHRATKWEFPRYTHARDIFVFSSYVTLIPLQCVPFILYCQDIESLVLDETSLNTDEFASILGVFMPSSLPSQLSYAFIAYPWASSLCWILFFRILCVFFPLKCSVLPSNDWEPQRDRRPLSVRPTTAELRCFWSALHGWAMRSPWENSWSRWPRRNDGRTGHGMGMAWASWIGGRFGDGDTFRYFDYFDFWKIRHYLIIIGRVKIVGSDIMENPQGIELGTARRSCPGCCAWKARHPYRSS